MNVAGEESQRFCSWDDVARLLLVDALVHLLHCAGQLLPTQAVPLQQLQRLLLLLSSTSGLIHWVVDGTLVWNKKFMEANPRI